MVSRSNFVLGAFLGVLFLISITAAIPLEVSPEQTLEDLASGANSNSNSNVKVIKPDPRTEYDTLTGVRRRPKPPVCASRHTVCRLHGPRPRKCCGEGVDLFCKVGYGEFYCFEKWESTTEWQLE